MERHFIVSVKTRCFYGHIQVRKLWVMRVASSRPRSRRNLNARNHATYEEKTGIVLKPNLWHVQMMVGFQYIYNFCAGDSQFCLWRFGVASINHITVNLSCRNIISIASWTSLVTPPVSLMLNCGPFAPWTALPSRTWANPRSHFAGRVQWMVYSTSVMHTCWKKWGGLSPGIMSTYSD